MFVIDYFSVVLMLRRVLIKTHKKIVFDFKDLKEDLVVHTEDEKRKQTRNYNSKYFRCGQRGHYSY